MNNVKYIDLYRGEGKTMSACKKALVSAIEGQSVIILVPDRDHVIKINQTMSYIVNNNFITFGQTRTRYQIDKGKIRIFLENEIEILDGFTCDLFIVDEAQVIKNLDKVIRSNKCPVANEIIVYSSKGVK